MTRLAVLGSTGSIGTATLELVAAHPDRFTVVALAAGANTVLLRTQIAAHQPSAVSVASPADARALATEHPGIDVRSGPDGLLAVAETATADVVVSALVGAAGLAPTVAALRAGNRVALANKEALVMAGELVMAEAAANDAAVLPVDSEHAAAWQLLRHQPRDAVDRLILTASGGPFRTWSADRMARATIDEALAHPTWRMGPKITVDSATMMNKGLEIIEAHHLFALAWDRIDVAVHPQSLVHAMVLRRDGTLTAHLAATDMRIPILAALSWPGEPAVAVTPLDPTTIGRIDLSRPDEDRFPALGLARAAVAAGGEMPAVLAAANEAAVEAFLGGRCSFGAITATISAVMESWSEPHRRMESVEQALEVDDAARRIAWGLIGNTGSPSGVPRS